MTCPELFKKMTKIKKLNFKRKLVKPAKYESIRNSFKSKILFNIKVK